MKQKNLKELGYSNIPTIIDMIKLCENKSNNMFEIHKTELRRIRARYYRKKQLSPNHLSYLQLLYKNFVLNDMKLNKPITITISKTDTVQHVGMKMFNSLILKTCKTCNKTSIGTYCSEKCYTDND